MTSTFDQQLQHVTKKGDALLHGILIECVDKTGKVVYSKKAGYSFLDADAPEIREDAVLKIASATKFITSIALLQCIERGQLTLDAPLTKILPELENKPIIKEDKIAENGYTPTPSKTPITARHLLTHTSGLAYYFLHPLLAQWRGKESHHTGSNLLTERYNNPLLFEPGQGWFYGGSLDWPGVVISRLNNNNISLESYFIEHIFKPLGRQAPFPTFHISSHPEYAPRLLQATERTSDGKLRPTTFTFGDNPQGCEGGGGLACTMDDYAPILADLISPTPVLLFPSTIDLLFTPQLGAHGISASLSLPMLYALKPAWEMVAGPIKENESVNHGLGGALLQGAVPEIHQPANVLCWGGASNIAWFVCMQQGFAGVLGTQIVPFANKECKEVVNGWKKDFWVSQGF